MKPYSTVMEDSPAFCLGLVFFLFSGGPGGAI